MAACGSAITPSKPVAMTGRNSTCARYRSGCAWPAGVTWPSLTAGLRASSCSTALRRRVSVSGLSLLPALPALAAGVYEDVTQRMSVRTRLALTAVSALLATSTQQPLGLAAATPLPRYTALWLTGDGARAVREGTEPRVARAHDAPDHGHHRELEHHFVVVG